MPGSGSRLCSSGCCITLSFTWREAAGSRAFPVKIAYSLVNCSFFCFVTLLLRVHNRYVWFKKGCKGCLGGRNRGSKLAPPAQLSDKLDKLVSCQAVTPVRQAQVQVLVVSS